MKQITTTLLAFVVLSLLNVSASAGALKPDCNPKKAGKNIAMKATVGVGGRCSPADAAKDSAKGAVGVEDKGALDKKGKKGKKNKNKKRNKKDDEADQGLLKKAIN